MPKAKRLSNTTIVLITLLVVCLGIVAFLSNSYAAAGDRKVELETELRSAKVKLIEDRKTATKVDELEQELSKLSEQMEGGGLHFPDRSEASRFPISLYRMGKRNGVMITSYASSWASKELGGMRYSVLCSQLAVKGEPLKISSFLSEVTEFPTVIIQRLALHQGEGAWTMDAEIDMYIAPEKEEETTSE